MTTRAPIGVFDSGLGGLSIAREIRARLPAEELLYFADTAFCPYGGRPLQEIRERSLVAAGELLRRGAKAIVVACNTASGAALEVLRGRFSVPIVGLEPAVKPAAEGSRTRSIGVMATVATLKTERYDRLTQEHARDVRIHAVACPGLVELVEAGSTDGPEVEETLRPLLAPLREAGVDAVVLGCTHYPFLREAVSRELGPGVRVLDSGSAVARQVERVLGERGALAETGQGGVRLLTSGDADRVGPVAERLWGAPLDTEGV